MTVVIRDIQFRKGLETNLPTLKPGEPAFTTDSFELWIGSAAGNKQIGGGSGSGDVVGPSSSTDNAVVRFDSTTGKLVQDSVVIIDDAGAVTGVTSLTASATISGATGITIGTTGAPTAGLLMLSDGAPGIFFSETDTTDKNVFMVLASSLFLIQKRTDAGANTQNTILINMDGPASVMNASTTNITFNDTGADFDFIVEGDTATNLFVVDAGLDAVQIGTTTAGVLADFRSTAIVFNSGLNDVDFTINADIGAVFSMDGATGEITFSGNVTYNAGITFGGWIFSGLDNGSTLFEIYSPSLSRWLMFNDDAAEVVFNEDGNDRDFRVETDTNENALFIDGASAGKVFIGDTANANMTIGVTINQGAADDEIVTLKSSDVDHGMTNLSETDSFGTLQKFSATEGGLMIRGFSEATFAVQFRGFATGGDTTKSTAALGPVIIQGEKKSGTGSAVMGTNENVVVFRNRGNAVGLIDAEGDLHVDGSGSLATFDDHDDVALLTGLRASLMPDGHELRRRFADWMEDARPVLERAGIVTYNEDGHHFVAMRQLNFLMIDAMRQMHERIAELEARIA